MFYSFGCWLACVAHLPLEQPEPGIWACFDGLRQRHWGEDTKHACVLQNMGIIMQNMGEAAEAAVAAAGIIRGLMVMEGRKSHGQGGASVGPAAYYRRIQDG